MSETNNKLEDRARQNLRLNPEIWLSIDAARMRRAGNISRNTWVTEAILEKLALEQSYASSIGKVMSGNV
jgi:hypothetical protein